MSENVERTSLDLRYQAYRLRNDEAEARLLASIAQRDIRCRPTACACNTTVLRAKGNLAINRRTAAVMPGRKSNGSARWERKWSPISTMPSLPPAFSVIGSPGNCSH